jgi:hypothetical protein
VGNQPLRVGPWEAIPASQLERAQTPSDLAFEQSRGLLELYQKSRRVRDGFGVFFRRGRRLVGENFTVKDLTTLRHVLLVAFLDRNPSDVGGDDTLNAGHQVWTSDNVDIIGHPIEVPFPILGRPPDPLYCNALWDVLRQDTDDVRRLAAAIGWLDLAWRNTPSTTHHMRVVMLKAGFEVLLGRGERIDRQRPALSALFDVPNPRKRVRHFTDRYGNPLQEEMTDLEWWFTRFTFLRNAITHGRRPTGRELRHGRHWHLWIAEYRLRQAIKEVIAQHGHPLVRMDDFDRAIALSIQRYGLE